MKPEAEEQETEDVAIESEAEEVEETEEEPADPEAEETSEPDSEEASDEGDEEVVVTIGDTPAPEASREQEAPTWVRELRKSHRETQRENRELKKQLEALNSPAPTQVKLGAKPKLEDYDYDTEKYDQELEAWYTRKQDFDKQEADAKAEQAAQQQAWQQKLDSYAEKKGALKVKNFEEAEANVLEHFDQTQQGIVIQGADDPAQTFYALGMNEGKLKELASIKDPVKFSFAVAKLETQIKVKNRKAPPPEKTVSGTAPKSGAVDSELERLRDEASRTGDYSKIHRYKKQKKQRQQAK